MKYFDEIDAPDKKLYIIKDVGHCAMLDNIMDYRNAVCEISSKV